MTESADANHAGALRGPNVELHERAEHGDAAAEQRPGFLDVELRGQGRGQMASQRTLSAKPP